MLQLIRSRVTSIFVKVLFGLLIVSFAIWGIGDIFRGGFTGRSAVTVGDVEIGPREILERFDRSRQSLSRQIGQPLGVREAAQFGILDAVIEEAVVDGLYAAEARQLGLAVGEETMRRRIADMPAFRDQLGQFSPGQFRQALFNAGMSEEQFLQALRDGLVREQITAAAAVGATTIAPFRDLLFEYRQTRRVAGTVTLPFDGVTDLPDPTDEELRAYHEANGEDFRLPETRRITFVAISPDDLASEILVPEDELKAEYEARKAQYIQAEQREVEQIFFADEAAARAAHDRVAAGEDFAAVAQDTTGQAANALSLGKLSRDSLPGAALADAVFGLAEGVVSEPVESSLGWHLFRVTAIETESVRPFEEVRDEIRLDLARVDATDAAYNLSTDLEDALAGGQTLEEAATALRLETRAVERLARDGSDGLGVHLTGLPATRAFIDLAFSTDEGTGSILGESANGGYFVLRPDTITESHIQPFEDARAKVEDGWRAAKRRDLARAAADDLVAATRGGTGFEIAAEAIGETVAETPAFTRAGDGLLGDWPSDFAAIAFETAVGELAVAESETAVVVLRVDRVVAPDPSTDKAALDQVGEELRGGVAGDIVSTLQSALRAEHAVEINRGFIDAAIQEQP